MHTFLLVRLEGPLQSWGDVAFDPRRPTRPFPSRSALAGLIASALGWYYGVDGTRTNALQDALHYAVREDKRPTVLRDHQTADLGRETQSWTPWGVEARGGGSSEGTQILDKFYLADASLLVALTLGSDAPVSLERAADALSRPARPLFLGRKSCPPATQLLEGWQEADSAHDALVLCNAAAPGAVRRCWYAAGDGPASELSQEIWDRRDFTTDRFAGSRRIVEGVIAA